MKPAAAAGRSGLPRRAIYASIEYSVISLECRRRRGAFVDFVYRTICNKMNERSEKSAKKRRVMQQFRTEYSVQYPVIRKSATDCHHAFCTVCSADINISHGGIGDIKKHVLTSKHTSLAKLREAKPVLQFFAPSSDLHLICSLLMYVIVCELVMSAFIDFVHTFSRCTSCVSVQDGD